MSLNIYVFSFGRTVLPVMYREVCPADIIQRDGRGLRFGNDNEVIRIYRYVTKDTFDAYLWQIQEQKLRYITQIMTSKSVSRSCEDLDETVLTAAEIKAIATSNPLIAEKMTVDNEVTRLKLLKGNWTNERVSLDRNINRHYPDSIALSEKRIEDITLDIAVLDKHKGGNFIIEIDGKLYDERPAAGEALMTVIKAKCNTGAGQQAIGSFRGLDLHAEYKNSIISSSTVCQTVLPRGSLTQAYCSTAPQTTESYCTLTQMLRVT